VSKNPLLELEKFGQSIWLDFISRDWLNNKKLAQLISHDGLRGLTSNPIIFERAIAQSTDYDQEISKLVSNAHSAQDLYEELAIKDIQEAADLLLDIYNKSHGRDGYVSLEVSPRVAHNAQKTIEEGESLWHRVNRPNLMIKVPGTPEGMHAIRVLTSKAININVTLLFSVESYRDAAMAYLLGLKDRADKNLDIKNIHSVASFFISRIDSKIDQKLQDLINSSNDAEQISHAQALLGKIAIANAKLAYETFEEIYQSDDAKDLLKKGANFQRLLWASTGTKNKNYSDIIYVENLIAKNTVNTLPPATLEAFRDHGRVVDAMAQNNTYEAAAMTMKNLSNLGIDFDLSCKELLTEGLKLFDDAFDKLLEAVKNKMQEKKNSPI
jgi:transaldolase/glucose-6-phosphate isomerase